LRNAYRNKLSRYRDKSGVSGIIGATVDNSMAAEKVIHLFLRDLPDGVSNDKPEEDDEDVIYNEGVVESLKDESCDKHSVFAALREQQALFTKKAYVDLVKHNHGNYCRNHVLIDLLLFYTNTVDELVCNNSAFAMSVLSSSEQIVTNWYRLFRLQSRIVVVVPPGVNWQEDNLSALLKHLLQLSIITIA
jgi:hypothetical protein